MSLILGVLLDNMNDEAVRIGSPLHLVSTRTTCWRCDANMRVITLLAPNVPGAEGEPGMLSNITALPEAVLAYVQQRFPTFQLLGHKRQRPICGYHDLTRHGLLDGLPDPPRDPALQLFDDALQVVLKGSGGQLDYARRVRLLQRGQLGPQGAPDGSCISMREGMTGTTWQIEDAVAMTETGSEGLGDLGHQWHVVQA